MDQTLNKKISLQELRTQIAQSSLNELSYLLGRYCGPHNIVLREKVYTYDAARKITDMVALEIASREIDNFLTDSLLSDN